MKATCVRCCGTFDDLPGAHKYGLCPGCDDPDSAYNRRQLEPQGGPAVSVWWHGAILDSSR